MFFFSVTYIQAVLLYIESGYFDPSVYLSITYFAFKTREVCNKDVIKTDYQLNLISLIRVLNKSNLGYHETDPSRLTWFW